MKPIAAIAGLATLTLSLAPALARPVGKATLASAQEAYAKAKRTQEMVPAHLDASEYAVGVVTAQGKWSASFKNGTTLRFERSGKPGIARTFQFDHGGGLVRVLHTRVNAAGQPTGAERVTNGGRLQKMIAKETPVLHTPARDLNPRPGEISNAVFGDWF